MRTILFTVAALGALPTLHAQSTLYRPANLGGTWVPDGGVVQFDFVHRFYVASPAGSHKVTNFPNFTLALGLGHDAAVGMHYSTNSLVVPSPYRPNETELYARWRPIGAGGRSGLALSLEPAYNVAARSADGELSADYRTGPLTLTAALRGMSRAFGRDTARTAGGGGAVVRLTDYIAVGGDVGWLWGVGQHAAWSVALDLAIPGTPHTFSLEASNATSGTIEGNSVGYSRMLYGFEFTIPLHLARFGPWFHGSPKPRAMNEPVNGVVGADVQLAAYKFDPDSVTISAGEIVTWTNRDPLAHTITFEDSTPGSLPVPPHGTFSQRFDKPGVYRYRCTPHPFMHGVVIVSASKRTAAQGPGT